MMTAVRLGSAALLLAMTVGFCGCGRTDCLVRGTVTYAGKPLPYGKVYLEPNAKKQNTGPQVIGEVRQGNLAFPPGRSGPVGPCTLRIDGYDGVELVIAGGMVLPNGKPYFHSFIHQVDVAENAETVVAVTIPEQPPE